MHCWGCARTISEHEGACPHCGDTFPYDLAAMGGVTAPEDNEGLLGVRVGGRYRLDAYLARGGMGVVFRGRDEVLPRAVAVKLIATSLQGDEDAKRRFLREARALSRIEHEHVVRAYDFGSHEGRPYLVMQFLEGESLSAKLFARRRLPLADAASLLLQVCDGLEHIHSCGFTHRDLKPQNLFLTKARRLGIWETRCVVLDFGILRRRGSLLTGSAEFLGTPAYAAPEQWAAPRSASQRSDIYALGVVLFEMVTGALPFQGRSFVEVRHAHATAPIPSVLGMAPELPSALDALIAKALAKDPQGRFSTARAMADAIEALLK